MHLSTLFIVISMLLGSALLACAGLLFVVAMSELRSQAA